MPATRVKELLEEGQIRERLRLRCKKLNLNTRQQQYKCSGPEAVGALTNVNDRVHDTNHASNALSFSSFPFDLSDDWRANDSGYFRSRASHNIGSREANKFTAMNAELPVGWASL